MKTHLPKGLRAALMAALAAVSITTAYGAAPLIKDQYAVDWIQAKLPNQGSIPGDIMNDIFVPTCIAQKGYYNGCDVSIGHINVVFNESPYKTGDIYFDVINARQKDYRSIIGLADEGTTANIYARIGNAQSNHTVNDVTGVGSNVKLTGNVYMELADSKATYAGVVSGSRTSDITGSSTLVIRAGTFNEKVVAGFSVNENDRRKISNGTYLQIEGGTFNADVMGGSSNTSKTATIEGGSHLLINGGTFYGNVYGGSGGTNGVVNGGVDITVSGGTFTANSNIYALGNAGKVNGDVNLTIGNGATFSSNRVISAGTDGSATYSGTSSTVTLKDLTGTSSLAKDSSIKVMGGQQGSTLVMNNVDTTIKAQLSNFTSMNVTNGSDLTLTQATNASLGGASTVTIDSGSTLTFDNAAGQTWDLSGKNLKGQGTLDKKGAGKLAISRDTSTFNGNVNIGAGTLEVQNTMNANTLSGSGKLAKTGTGTMTVKNASEFTGNIEVSGGTLQLEKVNLTGTKAPQKVSVSNSATVNLVGMGEGVDGATIELKIDGGTFGVYADGQAVKDGEVGGLTLAAGGKIVIGQNSGTLEANLTTLEDSVLDFTAGVELTMGCTLDVKDGTIVLLREDKFDGLKNGTLNSVTLFDGIDDTSMDAANVIICRGAAAGAEQLTAQVDFHMDGQGNGTLSVKSIPEPATGTLSLLALAGLCARRRRKH